MSNSEPAPTVQILPKSASESSFSAVRELDNLREKIEVMFIYCFDYGIAISDVLAKDYYQNGSHTAGSLTRVYTRATS